MNLIDDWKRNALRLWSVRLALLSIVLAVTEQVLPFFSELVAPKTFAILSIIVTGASVVARLVKQNDL